MIRIIGGGLAGSEAAWQAARLGVPVTLYEMRPVRGTRVHQTDRLAELVCSNSFRGSQLENAVGLLKEEMRRLGSLVIQVADETRVPAGGALAVDRVRFAQRMTESLEVASTRHHSARRGDDHSGRCRSSLSGHSGDRSADVPTRFRRRSSSSSEASISTSTTRSARSSSPSQSTGRRHSRRLATGETPPRPTSRWLTQRRRVPRGHRAATI